MDNDNKIKTMELSISNQRHQDVLLFLNEELKSIQESEIIKSYNLEEEYSHTRKNKSWFSIIMLLSCCIVVAGVSFGLNRYIIAQNEKITVNLSEFDDLNLKGLLDNVSKAQNNYDVALKTKLSLEAALEAGLTDATTKMENDKYLLDSLKIKSKKEYSNRLSEIEKDYVLRQKALHEEYDEKILVAEKELEIYKAELDKFDSVKIESAKAQEKAVNSERQLRELEKKELREEYESQIRLLNQQIENMRNKSSSDMHSYVNELIERYEAELAALDPVLKDSKATDIILFTKNEELNVKEAEKIASTEEETSEELVSESAPVMTSDKITETVKNFDAYRFIQENEINNEKVVSVLNEYQSFYDDYNYLDDAILNLPHKNSIPEYVTASRVLVNEMGEAFTESTAHMHQENLELEKQISVLKEDVKNQKKLVEAEKQKRAADAQEYEDKIVKTQETYEQILENTLILAKTNAVILSAETADNIKVFVASKVRDSVTSEGVPAEVRAGKLILKGKLVRNESDDFILILFPDKDGNPIEFDISLLTSGTAIKTSLK